MLSEYYGNYLEPLEGVMKMVSDRLGSMLEEITTDPEQVPVEHVISRIKGAESAKEKLRRKGYEEDAHSALIHLSDIIGIRVVTHFVGDIYDILDRISANPGWQVSKMKDYIASPKENGYRSLHVILNVPFDGGDISSIGVELQMRTIAMDCWAALEHRMRYKKDVRDSALINEELKRCANELASADLTMQTIRDVITEV